MERVSGWICAVGVLAAAAASGCRLQAGVQPDPGTGGTGGTGGASGSAAGGASGAAGATATGGTTGAAGATASANPFANDKCTGLECQQSLCKGNGCKVQCQGDARTTISGKVFDPAGKVPLYNAAVFVPNGTLDDIKDGPSCDPCDPHTGTSLLSGKPIVVTTTDVDGSFHLGLKSLFDAPAGTGIPLVIQVGKWRRAITVPTVTACVDNPITDMDQTRLPRTSVEGHIPKMALTTGGSDAMECLLRKIGIAESEFTPETGMGRVNLYQGGAAAPVVVGMGMGPTPGAGAYGMGSNGTLLNGGAKFTPADPWWDSFDNLAKYDLVMHSCDGSDYDPNAVPPQEPNIPKSMAGRMALQKYADLGGRVFASHFHTYWFEQGTPAFKSIGTFFHRPGLPAAYDATIDQSFPEGKVFAQWLLNVGGSTTLGIVPIVQNASKRLIDAAGGKNVSQRWIYASTYDPQSVLFLSATTPVPGGTCGRVVITDLHVSAGGNALDTDQPKLPFPTGCLTKDLSAREKALEFMLFDIASCVQPPIP
jgi:hypothetical protein